MPEAGVQAGSAGSDLGSSIGQLLGDFPNDDLAPETQDEGTDTGATPAVEQPPADSESSPTPPDPSVESEAERPDAAQTPTLEVAPPDEPDPLASALPLTYTVNGQERKMEGVKILGDEAIITREALPEIVRRLGERDNLYEQSQASYQKQQQFEAASAWKHTADDGTEQLLTGLPAIAEMRVSHARNEAALQTLVSALQDPAELRQMVGLDENDQLVLNPAYVSTLLTRGELAEIKAEQETRVLLGKLNEAARPVAQLPDFRQYAPQIIKQAAGEAFQTLSPKDQQTLGQQMLRYVRPTTPQEKLAGQGSHIVDAEFATLVQEWAGLRTEGAKVVQTAQSATTSNAARLAAARQGSKPPVAGKITPTTTTPQATQPNGRQSSDADLAWAARERAVAARHRQ